MTGATTLEFLYERDSTNRATDIWSVLERRADEETGIEVNDGWSEPDSWQRFEWGELSSVAMRAVENGTRPDGSSLHEMPAVEIEYDNEPFCTALDAGDDSALAQAAVDLLELVQYCYAAAQPRFVCGLGDQHRSRIADGELPPPVTSEVLAEDRIEYSCLLMGFPPSMVDTYGRETLMSAPAWQTTDLGDGGVVVLTKEDPSRQTKPEARAVDQHLGVDPPEDVTDCRY